MVEKLENFNEDIILKRDRNGIDTNVPRRIIYHSPDGFEWDMAVPDRLIWHGIYFLSLLVKEKRKSIIKSLSLSLLQQCPGKAV